jgi:hemoglobin/transferrin/lactoferrin receptor protein
MLNKTVFTILSLFFCLSAFAQDYYAKGSVRSVSPLKNVIITNIETGKSTQTDKNGDFILFVDTIAAFDIKIEAIGYFSQTFNVKKEYISDSKFIALSFAISLEPVFEKPINNGSGSHLTTNISRANLIQNAAPTLPDAIAQVSGTWLSRPSYMNNAISIRGMTGNRNAVYLDGIPLNHSMLSNRPEGLNLINLAEVQEINVSKGGATVSTGDGTFGGVINITTASPDYSDGALQGKVFASTRLSSSNEFILNGGSEISMENFAIRYGLSLSSIGISQQTPTAYTQFGGHIKGIAYLNRSQLEFGYNGTANIDYSDIYPNVDELYLDNLLQDQDQQIAYVKYNKVVRKGPFRIIKAKLAYQRFNEQVSQQLNSFSTYRLENTNNNFWFNLTGTSNLGEGWKMLSGIEFKQEFVNSSAYNADTTGISPTEEGTYLSDAKYSKVSLYNIHTLKKGDWDFEFGARGNWMNLKGSAPSGFFVQNRPLSIAGNVKAAYNINKTNRIIGSINSNYRTPTFEQFLNRYHPDGIFNDKPVFEINNNLVSEKSINFELAYRIKSARFNSQLALFRNQLTDIFEFTFREEPLLLFYKYENVGAGYVQGIELDIDAVLTSNFKLAGNIAYTHGRNTYQNLPMRYVPPVNGMVALNYQYKNKLTSSINYQFAGMQTWNAPRDVFDSLQEEIPVAAWNILNFNVGYQFKKANINAGIRNIFDENYRLYGSNVNDYRRNWWFGVRYNM